MFLLLRNHPELFVNQRVLHRPPLCQVYFFNWYQDEGLTICLFLDENRTGLKLPFLALLVISVTTMSSKSSPPPQFPVMSDATDR